MTPVYTVLLFLLLIGVAVYHARQSFYGGYEQGQEETLDKVKSQDIFSVDNRINPIMIKTNVSIPKEEWELITEKKYAKLSGELLNKYSKILADTMIADLLKNNLIHIDYRTEQDGSNTLEFILIVADNKNNFYEKMSKAASTEIIHPS